MLGDPGRGNLGPANPLQAGAGVCQKPNLWRRCRQRGAYWRYLWHIAKSVYCNVVGFRTRNPVWKWPSQ